MLSSLCPLSSISRGCTGDSGGTAQTAGERGGGAGGPGGSGGCGWRVPGCRRGPRRVGGRVNRSQPQLGQWRARRWVTGGRAGGRAGGCRRRGPHLRAAARTTAGVHVGGLGVAAASCRVGVTESEYYAALQWRSLRGFRPSRPGPWRPARASRQDEGGECCYGTHGSRLAGLTAGP